MAQMQSCAERRPGSRPCRQPRWPPPSHCRAELDLLEGSQHYDLYGYSRDQLVSDLLSQYRKHLHYLHLAR